MEVELNVLDLDASTKKKMTTSEPKNDVKSIYSGRFLYGNTTKGSFGTSRQSSWRRYESPLNRDFCDNRRRHPENAHYDVCVVDCDSGRGRGRPSRCREIAYEAKCGCKEGRPERIGITEYIVSFVKEKSSKKREFKQSIYVKQHLSAS